MRSKSLFPLKMCKSLMILLNLIADLSHSESLKTINIFCQNQISNLSFLITFRKWQKK
jgi:hypothetical protein